MNSTRKNLPPALRTSINRMAHEQAMLWEMRQRRVLTDRALELWRGGADAAAVQAGLMQADAALRLKDVAG